MIFSLALAGCSKGGPAASLPIGVDDDGGVGRSFTKLDVAAEVANEGGAGDATSLDVADGDTGGDSAEVGNDAAPPPIITVTVDPLSLVPPGDGGVPEVLIVPANYGPKPVVTVVVVSQSGNLRADDVSGVTASINDPVTGASAAFVKLAKSDMEMVPESDTARFIFSGVPLDLSKLATGQYSLVFSATTVAGVSGRTTLTLWVDTGPMVIVTSPTESGYYKGSAPVEVNATQTKFAITQVTMAIGQGSTLPLTETSKGVWKGNIDFSSFL
ncbi:MAG TPA: hypothetical protein VF518_15480, partial [Polyangia bacterium]